MKTKSSYTWKLGMFVITGFALLVLTIYYVGKNKNLFGSTFHLQSKFKTVSGLKVGNNVRFSGINIGTVNSIELITDTSVLVDLIIRKKYQEFLKTDAMVSIGSDGLMGDKVLTIYPGTSKNNPVKDGDMLVSKNAIEMEDVMSSVKTSVDNAGVITAQLALFTTTMNNGKGALSKLISDKQFSSSLQNTLNNLQTSSKEFAKFTANMNDGKLSKSLDSTMTNIQGATKGLNENMEAIKGNFLLRGYFKKKAKAEARLQDELNKKEADSKKKGDTILNRKIIPAKNAKDSITH